MDQAAIVPGLDRMDLSEAVTFGPASRHRPEKSRTTGGKRGLSQMHECSYAE